MNSYTSQQSTSFYDEDLKLQDLFGHNVQVKNVIELSNNASLSASEDKPMHKIQIEKTVTNTVRPATKENIIATIESAKTDAGFQNEVEDSYTGKLKSSESNCNKDDALVTLEHLARGIDNAFASDEYCAEGKELKLKDRDGDIELLENEVRKLSQELNEMKRLTGKVDNETHVGKDSQETENSCVKCEKEFEMGRRNDKMEKLEIELEEKITREMILTEENNNLQAEVKKLKDSLLEQQNANDLLLRQVKNLDERLKAEMYNSIEIRSQRWSLKRITRENSELQSRLQVVEQTNAKLLLENESLRNWNDVLYAKADNLEESIGDLQSCLTLSQLRYERLETTHKKVVKERDECHVEMESLRDTYRASKSRSDSRIEQLKEKCIQLIEDCKVRDGQIRRFEYELNQLKKTVVCSKERIAKRKRETIIYFNTAPLMDGKNLTDNWSVPQVGQEQQTLKPLVNKVC